MVKSVAFFVIGIFIGSGAFVVYQELQQEPEIRTGILSERSKQFLKKQEGVDALQYGKLADGKSVARSQRVTIDDCFSFVLPFQLKFSRRDGECDMTYGLLSPGGNVVAYYREAQTDGWEGVSGVGMRRQSSHVYEEKVVRAGGKEFLTFKNKEAGGYERNAFYRTPEYFIVINLLATTGQNLDGKFEEMLGSLEVK